MWIWFAIPLGLGIIGALMTMIGRGSLGGVYANGIIETYQSRGHDGLQVRAYVAERLVRELPSSSRLVGRMFIRETNTNVPLTFAGVPPYVPPKGERSDPWRERMDVPVLPVIFRFDPPPHVVVHPGQLVDVYVGER
jgi:HlyD family secretion protein